MDGFDALLIAIPVPAETPVTVPSGISIIDKLPEPSELKIPDGSVVGNFQPNEDEEDGYIFPVNSTSDPNSILFPVFATSYKFCVDDPSICTIFAIDGLSFTFLFGFVSLIWMLLSSLVNVTMGIDESIDKFPDVSVFKVPPEL